MAYYSFIKLSRKILHWKWYTDGNTFRVFLHLLLKANIKERYIYGTKVFRGELMVGSRQLCKELQLTRQAVRTALDRLEKTGEISRRKWMKYSIIHINKYDEYQSKPDCFKKDAVQKEEINAMDDYDPFAPFADETEEERKERVRLLKMM